jgi:hypothetical protein
MSTVTEENDNTGVPKVPPFIEGTSFGDVVECWKNV